PASSNPSGLAAANLPSPSRGLQQQQQLPPPPPPPLLSLRNCADMRPAIVQTADPIDEAPVLVTAADARLSSRGCRLFAGGCHANQGAVDRLSSEQQLTHTHTHNNNSKAAAAVAISRFFCNLDDFPAAIFCRGTDGQALTRLPFCQQFVYLGGLVPDVREDLRRRRGLPWSEALPDRQRVASFQAVIETVLLYNAETWTLTDSPEHWPASRRLQDRLRASHQSATLSQHWPAPSQQTVAPSATPAGRPFYPSRVVLPTACEVLLLTLQAPYCRGQARTRRFVDCLLVDAGAPDTAGETNIGTPGPAIVDVSQEEAVTCLLLGSRGLPNETLRLFGEDFGVHYIRSKTKSRVFVGSYWRDDRVRSNLCRLRPCLNRLSACPAAKLIDQDRQLTFNAVDLLCGLTELQQAGAGLDGGKDSVPYCLEGVLDLLQYAYARPWNWYFSKADALKSKYNVTFCERPIETAAAAEGKQ
uniref:Mab-21 domain-containing protein n=1 Tax=Macrostomum lignano TaxID=282301 RepID=A0A1I8JS78_9PLAT